MASSIANKFAALDSDDEDNTPPPAPTQQSKNTKNTKKSYQPSTNYTDLNGPKPGNKRGDRVRNNDEGNRRQNGADSAQGDKSNRRGPRTEGGRGGRGGRGNRSREFDRRSGTGRGKESSKAGGGARNWGDVNDSREIAAEAAAQEGKTPVPEAEGVDGAEVAVEAEAEAEEEEEENQMTYEEYLAKKQAERSGDLFSEKEARQAGDDFSNAKQLTKDGKTPDFVEAQFEKVYNKKTSGRKKNVFTDVGFQAPAPERSYRDDNRGRGGRRGNGRGGRGGRGRGRDSNAPNVGDMRAFPTLG